MLCFNQPCSQITNRSVYGNGKNSTVFSHTDVFHLGSIICQILQCLFSSSEMNWFCAEIGTGTHFLVSLNHKPAGFTASSSSALRFVFVFMIFLDSLQDLFLCIQAKSALKILMPTVFQRLCWWGRKCFSICKVFDLQNRDLAIDINGLGRCIPQACISCHVVCIRDLNQIILACDGHLANLLMEGTVLCYWY